MKYKGFKAQDVELIAEMASLIGRQYFNSVTLYTITSVWITAGGTIWLGNQYKGSYAKLSEVDLVEIEISK